MSRKNILLGILVITIGGILFFGSDWVGHVFEASPFQTVHANENKSTSSQHDALLAQQQHKEGLKLIDETWEFIRVGNTHYGAGEYEAAARAYEKAYQLDQGSRTFVAFKLVDTYEKLRRFDEGIAILDEIVHEGWSEKGLKRASEIRERLVSARNGHMLDPSTGPRPE